MNLAPLRILVVEDDEDDYVQVRDLLSETDESRFHLEWVANYDAALRAIERNQHDVYLLDYRLGERNGLELLRNALANGCRGPMILLTGQGDYKANLEAMQAGAADYLVKGQFDAPLLERSIRYSIERKLAEDTLRQQLTAINISMDGIAIVNEKGELIYINDALLEMFGYDRANLIGKPWQFLYDQKAINRLEKDIMPILWREGRWRGEVVGKRRDGSVFPQEISMNTIEGGGLVCIGRDITQRKDTEKRFQETSRLASIGELVAGVAHEINNPLTSVLGICDLTLAINLPDDVRASLEKIKSEAERVARIVQNLLSFARKHDPEKRYIDVNSIVELGLELKSSDFRLNNISVATDLSPDLPRTMADQHQLIQVIVNILTNAEQATRAFHGRSQITIRTSSQSDKIRISISDDGPGIPPENLNKIMEPFFTTKEVGVGTGLGLSICYGIIRQHGGDLWATSTSGQGATFHIELPVVVPEEEIEPLAPEPERTPNSTKRLLVVDDEPLIRSFLDAALTQNRYTVDLAEDGQEAWRKVQSESYDCIITDVRMPGMSGQELFQHIMGFNEELAQKTIFMTGDTASLDTQAFLSDASNPVLNKPFKLEELQREIFKLLESTGDLRVISVS